MRTRLLSFILLAAPAVAGAQTYPQGDGYGDQGYYEDGAQYYDDGQGYPEEYDDAAPDVDYVWEDGYVLDDGRQVDGFYRERNRSGFRWVSAGYSNGVWVDAHWEPLRIPAGYVVERGCRGNDGYWIADFLRPQHRDGYRWISGRWHNGRWSHGYWEPVQVRHDHVWVPGYWTADGYWVDGYWRQRHRDSYVWVDGFWQYGRWYAGYWKPVNQRPGFIWTPGYHGRKGYVDGHWREHNRSGYHWVDGHWRGGEWVPGHWERGQKRVVQRRHRVRPVHLQTRIRADHRRTWRNGVMQPVRVDVRDRRGERIERRGERIERRGERIQERGERIERRGERTGDPRLERRGERIQERGERIERRGERVQQRGERIQQDNRGRQQDRRDNRGGQRGGPRVHDRRNQ